ncbi:thrombospondin type 3 repeat-containing protein [Patescibacteria group bacterium AH-259-L07]|nr:thrombospondin type 3 repeat-containing protein [Patescibacteria group bacterium AH-259-L07]
MPVEKQNRRLVLFLTIFSVFIFVVGYFQFRHAIYAPFGGVSKEQTSQQIEQELSTLVLQDVDKDGLTDFDEQFVYSTSPYIADTDSDAYSDKEEVDAGSNPLDPKSTPYAVRKESGIQTQKEGPASAEASASTKVSADKTAGKEEILEKVFPAPEIIEEPTQIFKENLTGQEIRDLLIQSGIDKDIVDKMDDKTLIKLYNETIQETGINLEKLQGAE